MNRAVVSRLAWGVVTSLGALCLAGCAGQQTFKEANALMAEGKTDAGLAKLEEAIKLEPGNMEYRIALANRKASIIGRLLITGESARREGRLADAEQAYRQILALDPNQPMARQGLDALVAETRNRRTVAEAEALVGQGGAPQLAEAMGKLRTVFAESPNHKEAQILKARIDELQAKQQKPDAKLAAAYRKPITLEFRDAPLKSVFDLIAKLSGLNFFFDKDIRPDLRATILAKNTSIEDAVRLLLVTNQLEQKVLNENSVLIYPNTPQKLKDYQTLTVRTFFLSNADVKAVSNTIRTIVKTKDMVIDERLGMIMLRDTPEAVRVAERIVALQDLSDPEVMLEVEVLEITRSRLMELGIQWPGSLSLTPVPINGGTLTLDALRNLNGSSLQAGIGATTISANRRDQDVNTLANPRIRVRNKEKAKILIGDRVPIITTTSTSTGFVSESVNYVDVGLKLEVEPNIYMDEDVAIKINLEVSTLGAQTVSKAGTITYQIGTRGANTVLRLKDGETQILAGLLSDADRASANKVPGVGELPVVGRLFGGHTDDVQRSEILLSITPRVLRTIRRPELLAAEFDSGTETSIGADALRLASVEAAAPGAVAPAAAVAPAVAPATAALGSATSVPPNNPGVPASIARTSAPVAPPPPSPPLAVVASNAPPVPPVVANPLLGLTWKLPPQVRVGEQFSAVLQLTSQGALRGMPLLMGFDPQSVQVVSVAEGDFFRQANGRTNFNQRVDPAQGRIFTATVRQGASANDGGVNGSGGLVTVTFKAVKAGTTRIQVLSASPEPSPASPVGVPVEASVRIVP